MFVLVQNKYWGNSIPLLRVLLSLSYEWINIFYIFKIFFSSEWHFQLDDAEDSQRRRLIKFKYTKSLLSFYVSAFICIYNVQHCAYIYIYISFYILSWEDDNNKKKYLILLSILYILDMGYEYECIWTSVGRLQKIVEAFRHGRSVQEWSYFWKIILG